MKSFLLSLLISLIALTTSVFSSSPESGQNLLCTATSNFTCDGGLTSIPCHYLCDNYYDCMDERDEINCPYSFCWDTGALVTRISICDSFQDCNDTSDEILCDNLYPRFVCDDVVESEYDYIYDNEWAKQNKWTSPYGTIPRYYACSGLGVCEDKSDNENCLQCDSNPMAYHSDYRCDGIDDCGDRTDERDCPEVICAANLDNLFDCIPENVGSETTMCSQVCDTYAQCSNEYDESNCEYFVCSDGVKLPWYMQCDGNANCPDDSDETMGCDSIGPNFVCKDGTDLPRYAACDGFYDCVGGADEAYCMQCSGSFRRFHQRYLCDGHFDCGNGWDEENCTADDVTTPDDDSSDDVTTPDDDSSDDVTTPDDDSSDDVTTPDDDTSNDVATPDDDPLDDVTTPDDDSADDVTTPDDDSSDDVTTPDDDSSNDVATPDDDPLDDVTTPDDDSSDDVTTPEDDSSDDVATPDDDSSDDVTTPDDDSTDDVTTPEKEPNTTPEGNSNTLQPNDEMVYTMTFDVSLSPTECSNIITLPAVEISQLLTLLKQLFITELSLDESIDLEILGLKCGPLLIDFKIINNNDNVNRDYSDQFEDLAINESSFEWKGKTFSCSGVETRIVSSSVVESNEAKDDSKKAIWIPIVVFAVVLILVLAATSTFFLLRTKIVEWDNEKERNSEFAGTYVTKSDYVSSTGSSYIIPSAPEIKITPPSYDDLYG